MQGCSRSYDKQGMNANLQFRTFASALIFAHSANTLSFLVEHLIGLYIGDFRMRHISSDTDILEKELGTLAYGYSAEKSFIHFQRRCTAELHPYIFIVESQDGAVFYHRFPGYESIGSRYPFVFIFDWSPSEMIQQQSNAVHFFPVLKSEFWQVCSGE